MTRTVVGDAVQSHTLDTSIADAHTVGMRTLAALGVFVVFAAVLVGGVVWASDDTEAAPALSACLTGYEGGGAADCVTIEDGHCIVVIPDGDADTRRAFEQGIQMDAGNTCLNGVEFRNG
jgi:hypothetical protein